MQITVQIDKCFIKAKRKNKEYTQMKKTMAYKSKGMKAPRPEKGMEAKTEMASMAPKHTPKMNHSKPAGPYKMPKGGEQSMAPHHKAKAMTMDCAPKGVSTVNGGSSMNMPKGGGVGETEV